VGGLPAHNLTDLTVEARTGLITKVKNLAHHGAPCGPFEARASPLPENFTRVESASPTLRAGNSQPMLQLE